MGISWSKRRYHDHQPLPLPPSSSSTDPPSPVFPSHQQPTQLTTPPPPVQSPQPPSYAFAANAPRPIAFQPPQPPSFPAFPPRPPPPPLPPYSYTYSYTNNYSRPVNVPGQYSYYRPYYVPQVSGWGPSTAAPLPPPTQPAPYVDHQSAKRIKNDVNVHKDTIRLEVDEKNPDCHLVSFTFDALVDGSITIFYFAKEGDYCTFTPLYPEIVPVKVPFQKGLGQKFCQPSGTGLDLGFFETDDLSKPVPGEDVYPLVISAESPSESTPVDEQNLEQLSKTSHRQISQAVLEKKDAGNFQVKVMKQILWIDGARYELREIFGISGPDEPAVNELDSGKECVICMTEEKNTAVLPCRHMCMCSGCAKELRLQSDKCPVCRQPIKELLEIKVDEDAT